MEFRCGSRARIGCAVCAVLLSYRAHIRRSVHFVHFLPLRARAVCRIFRIRCGSMSSHALGCRFCRFSVSSLAAIASGSQSAVSGSVSSSSGSQSKHSPSHPLIGSTSSQPGIGPAFFLRLIAFGCLSVVLQLLGSEIVPNTPRNCAQTHRPRRLLDIQPAPAVGLPGVYRFRPLSPVALPALL